METRTGLFKVKGVPIVEAKIQCALTRLRDVRPSSSFGVNV